MPLGESGTDRLGVANLLIKELRAGGMLREGIDEREAVILIDETLVRLNGDLRQRLLDAAKVSSGEEEQDLSVEVQEALIDKLKIRFQQHIERHPKIKWEKVEAALRAAKPEVLYGLMKMETAGGEPDIADTEWGSFVFAEFSESIPTERLNCVYDAEAEVGLEGETFNSNALKLLSAYGPASELMTLGEYEDFVRKFRGIDSGWVPTSTWLKTKERMRRKGFAQAGKRSGSRELLARTHDKYLGFRCICRVPKA